MRRFRSMDRAERAIVIFLIIVALFIIFQVIRVTIEIKPVPPDHPIKIGSARVLDLGLPTVVTIEDTTTTIPPTTSTVERTTIPRANRGERRATSPVVMPAVTNVDFWRRLANCESADGHSGVYIGFFQFSHDTARKLSIDGSESYDTQLAAAQHWAGMIHPREGTKSGWPKCWWIALRG